MNIDEYLNEAKKILKIDSDSKLSLYLGNSRGTVCGWRTKKNVPDEYSSFLLAEILNVDPRKLIADIRADVEKDEMRREFWQEKVKEYGFITASFQLVILSMFSIAALLYLIVLPNISGILEFIYSVYYVK